MARNSSTNPPSAPVKRFKPSARDAISRDDIRRSSGPVTSFWSAAWSCRSTARHHCFVNESSVTPLRMLRSRSYSPVLRRRFSSIWPGSCAKAAGAILPATAADASSASSTRGSITAARPTVGSDWCQLRMATTSGSRRRWFFSHATASGVGAFSRSKPYLRNASANWLEVTVFIGKGKKNRISLLSTMRLSSTSRAPSRSSRSRSAPRSATSWRCVCIRAPAAASASARFKADRAVASVSAHRAGSSVCFHPSSRKVFDSFSA